MWQIILLSIITYGIDSQVVMEPTGTLVVNIENIHLNKGSIHIALYDDPTTFSKDEGVFFGEIIQLKQAGSQQWIVEDLSYRKYALAIFHDINSNGKMDRNLLGVPKEPYAFSKKEPSKWREPTFQDVAFQMNAPEKKINVSLDFWKDR